MKLFIVLAMLTGILFAGCKSKVPKEDATTDAAGKTETSQQPMQIGGAAADGADTVTTPSGLRYVVLKAADGASPQNGQTVSVHYTGWLTNGRKFDSSLDRGEPLEFELGTQGINKRSIVAIATKKVGETRKLMIPAEFAFGDRCVGDRIPPGATLVYDIVLLAIK